MARATLWVSWVLSVAVIWDLNSQYTMALSTAIPTTTASEEASESSCRDWLPSGNHTRLFRLISEDLVRLDRFDSPLLLDGSTARPAALRTDTCPGAVSLCPAGFTLSLWLEAGLSTGEIGEEGAYYLSSGAQRAESCGLYVRLASVGNDTASGPHGVFDIGVATADTVWRLSYRAALPLRAHLLVAAWSPVRGLDVHVDGACVGSLAAGGGHQREPAAACDADPFQQLYIGRRNDDETGFATGAIGQFSLWDAWMNPSDVVNQTEEGVLRAYYEGCVPATAISSSHALIPDFRNVSDAPLPEGCRHACSASGFQYAAVGGGDGAACSCLAGLDALAPDEAAPEGSCAVCAGYVEITCGGADSWSLYRLTSLLGAVPSEEGVGGFSVSIDGVESVDDNSNNYTVITQRNVVVGFSLSAGGEDALYSVYGDGRLAAIETYEATAYLVFPEPGLYRLTAAASSGASRAEADVRVTARDDPAAPGSLHAELASDGPAATLEPLTLWLEMSGAGPGTACSVDYGDGSVGAFQASEPSSIEISHRYASPAVYIITARCGDGGSHDANASTPVTVQDPVSVALSSTFRVAKGADLSVPFQLAGTDIAGLTVLFDGIADVAGYTCSQNFTCEGRVGRELTNATGTHVFEIRAGNLVSASVSARADVYVGVPVEQLSYGLNATAVTPDEWVQLTADIAAGSEVYLQITFNGSVTVFSCPLAPCAVSQSKAFPNPGEYRASVEVSNDFNSITGQVLTVSVYNPVPALSLELTNSSSTQDPVRVRVYPTSGASPWPTEATVVTTIGGFESELETSFAPVSDLQREFLLLVTIPVYGEFVINLNISNAVSSAVLRGPVQIGERIGGFHARLPSEIGVTGDNVSVEFGYSTGSEVLFLVDFGDGQSETHTLEPESPSNRTGVAYHTYGSAGDYTLTVRAQNALEEKRMELSLRVVDRVGDLLLVATDDRNVETDEQVHFVFYLGRSVTTPLNVQCYVAYENDSEVDVWSGSLTDGANVTRGHAFASPGPHLIRANCSNEASRVALSLEITAWRPATACSLTSDTPVVPTDAPVHFTARAADDSSVEFSIFYGDGLNASSSFTTGARVFQHVYDEAGTHTVYLEASNPISSCVAGAGPIVVQKMINGNDYQLQVTPAAVDVSNQTTTFALALRDNAPAPTNVTAHWDFGDGNTSAGVIPAGSRLVNTAHVYQESGVYEVRVSLSNLVSRAVLNGTLDVQERIADVEYNISSVAGVGQNLTLSVLAAAGSPLSYAIDFGDGAEATSFQERPDYLILLHSYDNEGTYTFTLLVENELGSFLFSKQIRVLYPVQGLRFEASESVMYSPGNATFSLSLDDGDDDGTPHPTDMGCVWHSITYGHVNLVRELLGMPNVTLAPGQSINVTAHFRGGRFRVRVLCYNALDRRSWQRTLTVYEAASELRMTATDRVLEVGSRVGLAVGASEGSMLRYAVRFGDGQVAARFIVMSDFTETQWFYAVYTSPGLYRPSASVENDLGQWQVVLNHTVEVLHSTRELSLSSDGPATFPGGRVTFTLSTVPGGNFSAENLQLWWDFGDGTSRNEIVDFANMTYLCTHAYNAADVYHASVTAATNLDSITLDATVVITLGTIPVQIISEYNVGNGSWTAGLGPDSNWFPVGSDIRMTANLSAQDATLVWHFGDANVSDQEVVHRRYESPGQYNITLEALSDGSTLNVVDYLLYLVRPLNSSATHVENETEKVFIESGNHLDLSFIGEGLEGPFCVTLSTGDSSLQYVLGSESCETAVSNASVFIPSQPGAGFSFTHTYTSPGHYTVNVSLSNMYTTESRLIEVTVAGCWEPPRVDITGPGETTGSPRTHRATEAVLLQAAASLDCLGVGSPTVSWSVYGLTTDESGAVAERLPYVLPLPAGPRLDLEPGALAIGLYEFVVNMTVGLSREMMTDLDEAYIRIEPSPLALQLEGGSGRAVGNLHPLVLDAGTSSYDPDNSTGAPSAWPFKWSCSRLSDDGGNASLSPNATSRSLTHYLCDNSSWEVLNNASAALVRVDTARLRVGGTYIFRAEVTVDSRRASIEQTVTILPGDPPHASISCVSNCRGKTNPTSSFTLQGACANCLPGNAQFTWSLFKRQRGSGEFEVVGNLGDMTSTGVSKQGIAFTPNRLEAGREYHLQLDIRDALLGDGFTQYSFLTNLPPYNGSCQILPPVGYAVTTEFLLECSGWLDEGHAVDRAAVSPSLSALQPLHYQLRTRPMGAQTPHALKASSSKSPVSGIVFGLGPEEFGFVHEAKVGVVDAYGATAHVYLTVKVERPSLSGDDITNLVSGEGSSLSLLVSGGDVEGATQLIAAVLSVLPGEEDVNSTLTAEEVNELRTELVVELGRISVWAKTAEALHQASAVMALSLTGGVNDQILLDAASTMAAMARTLENLESEDPEVILDTAQGLTDGLGSLIAKSDAIVLNTVAAGETAPTATEQDGGASDAYGDDLSPEDRDLKAAQEEEAREKEEQDARQVSMTISTLAQDTLALVSDVLLSQRVSGEPPVSLVTDKLTLEVFKDEPASVAQRVIDASAGSFQLPDAASLFGEDQTVDQVQQIVYSYNSNPFSFSESSETIGSAGVLSLELRTGEGSSLAVSNLTEEISIVLPADQNMRESTEVVTLSFENASSVLYHKVELTETDVQLRLAFQELPDNGTAFLIHLRRGGHPNGSLHDALAQIPRPLGAEERWDDERLETEARHTAVFPAELLTGVGDYYLAISIAGLDQTTGANQTGPWSGPTNVTVTITAAGCRYWDTDASQWSGQGCKVGPLTCSQSTHCLCNHLTTFAASVFVPPNSIDFSTVFAKFLDLGNNAAVFSTVLAFFGVYLILLVWLRRKDKQDIVKWGVSPLTDNRASDTYFYQVTVQTGMGPGSGTKSKVGLVLTGEDGDSGVRLLDDDKRKVFERGSICHFLMGVSTPLGPLSYLKIWHDNSGQGPLASWHLSQVSIIDLQNGQQFYFICDRWLAVERDDGAVERVLPVASRADLTRFSTLFYSSSRQRLFDDHIWFSLFSRPTRSPFTRVQRLSCCLCLLYLSMIASAMFYRAEEEAAVPGTALRLGPLIFTLQQVFVGFVSALVVVPVNVLIVQIFRKSRPSAASSSSRLSGLLPKQARDRMDATMTMRSGEAVGSADSTPRSSLADFRSDADLLVPSAGRRRRAKAGAGKGSSSGDGQLLLPHWCVYVGWALMVLSSLAAAFFTVLYSLEWGNEKSCEWLTSMLVSLVNSVIVIQPFKVLVLAIVVSLVFKKPSKMDVEFDGEFSSEHNRLQADEELLHQKATGAGAKYQLAPPPSKAALDEARQKRLKEIRLSHVLRETGLYTLYVALVLFLCYSNRDSMSFHMSQSLRNIFLDNNGAGNATGKLSFSSLEKSTPELFWRWVETALIPGLYSETAYNGDPMHWRHTRYVADWQGYRVGPVRLRQLRVKNESCEIPPGIQDLHSRCHLHYSWTNQEEGNFSVAWRPQDHADESSHSAAERAPWAYRDFLDLNGVPYPGTLALYSGGGYVAEFGTSESRALSAAGFLRDAGWYDALTRAVFVEFSVYNANVDLFSVATLLVESSTLGGALVMSNVHTLRLYHYGGPLAIVNVILQAIFVVYLVYFMVKLILVVKNAGLKELRSFWSAIELTMLLTATAAIVMFVFRQVFIELALQDVKNKDQGEFVNFSHIAKWDELFGYLLACLAFLSLLRYMRLLRLSARMSLLGLTLGNASKDLFYFAIMWNLIFLAFGQLAYFLFQAVVGTFSSFVSTLETMFAMLLGKFDFEAMVEANRYMGEAVFLLYIMTMYMVLTNMFVTIVTEAFTQTRSGGAEGEPGEAQGGAGGPELVDFMLERFKAFFFMQGAPRAAGKLTTTQVDPYEQVADSLVRQVNRIVTLVEGKYGKLELPSSGRDVGTTPGSSPRSLSRISLHPRDGRQDRAPKSTGKARQRVILIA